MSLKLGSYRDRRCLDAGIDVAGAFGDLPFEWRLPFLIGGSPLARLLGDQPSADLLASVQADLQGDDRRTRRLAVAVVGFAWLAIAMACLAISVVLAVAAVVLTGDVVATWPTWPMVMGLPSAAAGVALLVGGALAPGVAATRLLRVIVAVVFVVTLGLMIGSQVAGS
ncbi:MAG: hypothetical protein QOK14_1016 [Frankiaceae bacterium]|jgi:hypothetical protein|nr:hypothetical protein [Frankiaceae bacterium]